MWRPWAADTSRSSGRPSPPLPTCCQSDLRSRAQQTIHVGAAHQQARRCCKSRSKQPVPSLTLKAADSGPGTLLLSAAHLPVLVPVPQQHQRRLALDSSIGSTNKNKPRDSGIVHLAACRSSSRSSAQRRSPSDTSIEFAAQHADSNPWTLYPNRLISPRAGPHPAAAPSRRRRRRRPR